MTSVSEFGADTAGRTAARAEAKPDARKDARAADKAALAAAAAAAERRRDPRLDFFRGLGMFIILCAHIPWNTWQRWIPARFGFSDATEIFVFCSGAASAIAFYRVFRDRGWWLGTSRVAFRIWQIYWCHIGVFIAVCASLYTVDAWLGTDRFYQLNLNLGPFLDDPGPQLAGLLTLTYVPNLFDILPMYIVILALMPVMAALAHVRVWLALAFSFLLWLFTSQPWLAFIDVPVIEIFNLPAEPWSERTWFFNPFAWQLVFFTGFAFSLGWLPRPKIDRRLMWAAAAFLLISIPLDPDGEPAMRFLRLSDSFEPIRETIRGFWRSNEPLFSKPFLGVLRYVHFLALAYLAWALAGERGAHLPDSGIGGKIVTVIRRVGQQSLQVFVVSLVLSQLLGAAIHEIGVMRVDGQVIGYNIWVIAAANLFGFAVIIGVAYLTRFFRRQPWRQVRPAASG